MASCITYVSATNKIARRRGLYNVGTKSPFRALDLIDAIKKWLPDAKINYSEVSEPTKLSMGVAGPSGLDVDCSKLYDELGFKEKMGMAESVRDMIDHERRAANLACV
jgi:UDP-glucose 4-epimerase